MSQLARSDVLREIFSSVIDGGDYSQIDRYFTPDFVDHSAVGDQVGTTAFAGMLDGFRSAMPGFRHEISDITLIDYYMALWLVHVSASFTGTFMGTQGDGRPIDQWVANAARFAEDGRVCEHWGMANDTVAELVRQMGVDANNLASAS